MVPPVVPLNCPLLWPLWCPFCGVPFVLSPMVSLLYCPPCGVPFMLSPWCPFCIVPPVVSLLWCPLSVVPPVVSLLWCPLWRGSPEQKHTLPLWSLKGNWQESLFLRFQNGGISLIYLTFQFMPVWPAINLTWNRDIVKGDDMGDTTEGRQHQGGRHRRGGQCRPPLQCGISCKCGVPWKGGTTCGVPHIIPPLARVIPPYSVVSPVSVVSPGRVGQHVVSPTSSPPCARHPPLQCGISCKCGVPGRVGQHVVSPTSSPLACVAPPTVWCLLGGWDNMWCPHIVPPFRVVPPRNLARYVVPPLL